MIRAIDDRIIVEPIAREAKKSSVIIPDSLRDSVDGELPSKGKVIAVGTGIKGHVDMKVIIGDTVLFGKHAGVVVDDKKGNRYLSMRQSEVLAII